MSDNNKKDLLSRWLNRSKKGKQNTSARLNEIVPMPKDAPKKLSYGQKRLWMLQQLNPENAFYNYAEIYRIIGFIDIPMLKSSIANVIDRHEILRTVFIDSEEGLIQRINEGECFHFIFESCVDKSPDQKEHTKEQFVKKIGGESFNLVNGPLVRIGLLHLDEDTYILLVNMHHIITDKWSMRVFREELAEIYNATIKGHDAVLGEPKLQFSDFAYWEQEKGIDQKQMKYWVSQLANAPEVLNLTHDYQRPKVSAHKGAFCKVQINDVVSKRIEELCKEYDTTHYVFYLTVFTILLQRYCRQDDILIGTPISNRNQSSLERMIGFFNETIVLRFNLDAQHTFVDFLRMTRTVVLDAFSNKDVPLEVLIKELGVTRDVSINPLFQSMFLYHKVPEKPVWEGFEITYETLDAGVSKFDLTLYVAQDENGYAATFEYDTELFHHATIERMLEHYTYLLEQISTEPNIELSKLSLASQEEIEAIYVLNQNDKKYSNQNGIHFFIENQLTTRGKKTAVTSENKSWNYEELVQNGYKIAHQLIGLGIKKGDVVAVCTNRSVEMVGAILGTLMAGAVYMPLDPTYPLDRINYILGEADVNYALCEEAEDHLFSGTVNNLIHYKSIVDKEEFISTPIHVPVTCEDNAYLIFTSGSSGKPKGVKVSHANIIHSTLARDDFYVDLPECFLLLSSFAFDSSMVGLFWTLCRGGNLVLTPEKIEQDMHLLSQMILKYKVTHTLMLPSLYQILLNQASTEKLASLKCVIVAGEACLPKMCTDHFDKLPEVKLYNEYGPTEASVWCSGYEITQQDLNSSIPIGTTITSTDLFIVDPYGQLVPRGIPGEIYIGGRGITNGYINRPDLTAEKFIDHNFRQEFSSRLYKSGDLGKMRLDGVLEFMGRVDQQIKIRGFRVELSEIQNVLQSISEFDDVVAVAIKNEDQENSNRAKSIVAYYITSNEVNIQKVNNDLRKQLPDYMVPSLFIKLDTLPKLPNGKYDYKFLERKEISGQIQDGKTFTAPRNAVEKALVSIWEEVLSVQPIGIYNNFFSLGGDSILSIQINGKAHNLGLKFPANEIFKSQTIAELAQHVELKKETQEDEVFSGEVKLTPIQRWYLHKFKNKRDHWHLGVRFDFESAINSETLESAIDTIVKRHEALRLRFYSNNIQVGYAEESTTGSYLSILDAENQKELDKEEFIQSSIETICSTASLEKGELFKCLYLYGKGKGDNCLILIAHHLVVDQVSWYILIEELEKVVIQIENGQIPEPGTKSFSYHHWTPKLKEYMQSAAFKSDRNYWQSQFKSFNKSNISTAGLYTEEDVVRMRHTLDPALTEKVTRIVPQQHDAKVNEVLISALLRAMKEWRGISSLIMETEGHGRESIDPQISFHNSVGWYTSVYPIFCKIDDEINSHANLQYTKNLLRSIPTKGLTFGMCRYLQSEAEIKDFDYQADILFNYLGNRNSLEGTRFGKAEMLAQHMRSKMAERLHPLEFNVYLENDEMVLECSFVNQYCNKSEFEDFIHVLKKELVNISEIDEVNTSHNYVPADFQDVDLDEEDLDSLFDQL
ncbi:MAG: amino acid adenylation domain-containing protein [Bacteroidota bacterium]